MSIASQFAMYSPSAALRLITPSRSRNTAFIIKLFLDNLTKNMPGKDMRFLDSRRLFRRNTDAVIDSAFQLTSGPTGHANCQQSTLTANLHSVQNICRIAACTDSD